MRPLTDVDCDGSTLVRQSIPHTTTECGDSVTGRNRTCLIGIRQKGKRVTSNINEVSRIRKKRLQMARFRYLKKIGSGTYGDVYQALDTQLDRIVAVKCISYDNKDEGVPQNAVRELSALSSLKHPNIIGMVGYEISKLMVSIAFEYVEKDLHCYLGRLAQSSPLTYLSPHTIRSFMRQILQAVYYCHSRNIIHRDLKTANILVTDDNQLKLIDFGLSRIVQKRTHYTNNVVTVNYRAPELLLGATTYTEAIDMWSIGCIFVELATLEYCFDTRTEMETLKEMFMVLGPPTRDDLLHMHTDDETLLFINMDAIENDRRKFFQFLKHVCGMDDLGVDLLDKLFQYNPKKRLTAEQALDHPYFAKTFQLHDSMKSSSSSSLMSVSMSDSSTKSPWSPLEET